ncbi:MAG: tyrosine-type recombinase/integrase, partial [Candidatus Rokuibacteriota bacterium]
VAKALGKPIPTERDAERLLEHRLKAKLRGQAPPTAGRLTVKAICEAYSTHLAVKGIKGLRRHQQQVQHVIGWLGHERADRLTLPKLEAAVRDLQGLHYVVKDERRPYARGTIKVRLAVLHAAMVYAQAHLGLAAIPPFPKLAGSPPRRGLINDAELARILGQLPEAARDAVRFGALTGWRVGEIRGLTWDRVDFQAATVRLDDSKSGQGRLRPLVEPELRELLERRRKARALGCPSVFHRNGHPLSDTWLGTAWRAACDAAGLPGRYFHDLRRSAYRDLVSRAGIDLVTAMELVGHRSLSVAQRYNIVEPGRLTRALDLVTKMRVSDKSRTTGGTSAPSSSS